jgi:hypothetical protein
VSALALTVRGARVESRTRWQAVVVVDTAEHGEVWTVVGVPDSDIGTAQTLGSDSGLVDVWPVGDSLDCWLGRALVEWVEAADEDDDPWHLERTERIDQILGAVSDAARAAHAAEVRS